MSAAHDDNGRTRLIDRIRDAFGIGSASLREDIEDALEQTGGEEGDFSPQERAILRNVLDLHEQRVDDIKVPRADIIATGVDATLAEVLNVFRTAGHSRLPVHGDTLDDPRGMIHIRDLVDYLARQAGAVDGRAPRLGGIDFSLPLEKAGIIRPVLFAPPSMPALDLLVKMQASRTHMALVIDEYGGTDGLVSIEDVVEMIVGDIEDEHDLDETPRVDFVNEREYIADARANLDDAHEATGVDFSALAEESDIDTLGGLVAAIAGRVPARGEIVRSDALPVEFEIVDADPRRVKRVRLRLSVPPPAAESPDQA
ncbi:MAG: HlyC/CorC family transporter [Hyphomicrobiales bacterium]|nr:HlyC/CorC family transporter [Hyphomicrobiales bacterium]